MPIHLLPDEPTRRRFLAGLALGGASLAWPRSSRADEPSPWYALVADTHIAADPKASLRGQVMADNLRAVVADLNARPTRPAGVFVDGDLALLDGQVGDYRTFLDLITPLRDARLPIHLALGNHDDRDHFSAACEVGETAAVVVGKHCSLVDGAMARFVVLDSLDKVNKVPGVLGGDQLRWLSKTLDAAKDKATVVLVHHNPSKSFTALTDTEALMAVLRPRRQVKALVFGHTHTYTQALDDGIHLVNLPAVAYPFAAGQPLGWCRLDPREGGATLTLRCVGGDKSKDGETLDLKWRPS